eukprot:8326_1
MGSGRSSHQAAHDGLACTCFNDDKSVTSTTVVHDITKKWIWSANHDSVLIECLSQNNNQFPLHVIYLIKDHAYSTTNDHYVSKAIISQDKYYSKPNLLLSKKLCSRWYHQYFVSNHPFRSLSIALFDSDKQRSSDQIFNHFCNTEVFLPTLQWGSDPPQKNQSAKRTVHVDGCTVSIHLSANTMTQTDLNAKQRSGCLKMFILDENTDINQMNRTIQAMNTPWKYPQPSTSILVSTNPKGKAPQTRVSQQICRNYNIPCFGLSLQCSKSMHDLFVFCIKYYWFCMVK